MDFHCFRRKIQCMDYELILSKTVIWLLESTMIYHNPEVKENSKSLAFQFWWNIPVMRVTLGRTEWVKLYGVLLDKEE